MISVLALVVLAVALVLALWAEHQDNRADDLAAAAVVLTAGALAIAVLAGALAIVAYAESIRRPKLTVRAVVTTQSEPGDVFSREAADLPEIPISTGRARDSYTDPRVWRDASEVFGRRCWLHAAVGNDGDATARYVVLTVEIHGLQTFMVSSPTWMVLDQRPNDGWVRLQWDGGSDLTVHPTGGIGRRPQSVMLDIADVIPGSVITVDARAIADGTREVRSVWEVPVAPQPPTSATADTDR